MGIIGNLYPRTWDMQLLNISTKKVRQLLCSAQGAVLNWMKLHFSPFVSDVRLGRKFISYLRRFLLMARHVQNVALLQDGVAHVMCAHSVEKQQVAANEED